MQLKQSFLGLLSVAFVMSGGIAKADQVDIIALISDTSNPYWKTTEDGLENTAKEMGIKINVYSLQNAADSEGQLNQCEAALLKNPKAIIFSPVDSVNLGSCLRKATEKKIVLVDIDGNIDENRVKEMGSDVAFSVGSNNYEIGKKAAEYLDGQTGKVLIIEGPSSSPNGLFRVQGFQENMGKGLTVIASQPADWDRLKAADITSSVVTKNPDLSIVFAANDTMALGAVEALRALNINSVKVIGIDGTVDAVQSIKEGRLTASVAQLPYLMAKEAIKKTDAFLKDRKALPFRQYVPILTLDQAVFERNDDPLLQYVR